MLAAAVVRGPEVVGISIGVAASVVPAALGVVFGGELAAPAALRDVRVVPPADPTPGKWHYYFIPHKIDLRSEIEIRSSRENSWIY